MEREILEEGEKVNRLHTLWGSLKMLLTQKWREPWMDMMEEDLANFMSFHGVVGLSRVGVGGSEKFPE